MASEQQNEPSPRQTFFVFIRVDLGKTYEVGRRILRDVPYVKEVSSVSGTWDLLVKIVIDTREDVGELINEKLAAIPGIRRTKTMVAYFVYDREDVFF
ncbi:MAG: Lrp/AsnC ligand binding domain-containing protein [Thermaurantiacus sp.]